MNISLECLNFRGGAPFVMTRVSGGKDSTAEDCGTENGFELHFFKEAKAGKEKTRRMNGR